MMEMMLPMAPGISKPDIHDYPRYSFHVRMLFVTDHIADEMSQILPRQSRLHLPAHCSSQPLGAIPLHMANKPLL